MRIEYRRTFSLFVDDYISKYYSTGARTFSHLAGGPTLIFFGIIGGLLARRISSDGVREFSIVAAGAAIIYGAYYIVRPLLNIFLVWLRKDEFLGPEGALVSLELDPGKQTIQIVDQGETMHLNLVDILRIQHRSASAWILTKTNQVISIPRHDLIAGDLDDFIKAVETILEENEQSF